MSIRWLGVTLPALVLVLAVACGGGGGSSPLGGNNAGGGSNTWDLSKADDLAHAALIVAGDLPGSGWSVDDDDFTNDDKPMNAACGDFEGFKKDARNAQTVRAKRQLEKAGATRNDFGTQVESTITVFKDAKTASDLANRYKGIVASDKFVSCFEAEIRDDSPKTAKIAIKRSNTNASAPNGGTSTGLDVDVSEGSDSLQANTENHVWVSGNAVIQLNITATKQSFNADLIKQAVAKQDQAVNDALKGTRQRSASATPTPSRSSATPTPSRPSGSPTPSRGASSGGNLGNLGKLEDTNSHRYTVRIEETGIDFFGMQDLVNNIQSLVGASPVRAGAPITFDITGAYSKPDKGQVKFVINNATLSQTTIGTQQWVQYGSKTEGPKSVGRQSAKDLSLAANMFESMLEDQTLLKYLKCSGTENVNGVSARKCGFMQADLSRSDQQEFIDGFLEDSDANVTIRAADVTKITFYIWPSQQGDYVVKFQFEFTGKDSKGTAFNTRMEANVTDINKTVDIVAPR